MNDLFSVKDKTVIITGASRGIGKVFALGFRDAGAIVYGTGTKPDSISWMEKEGIHGRVLDVSKPDGIEDLFKEIKKKHGLLNCLINNAGIAWNKPASAFKEEDIQTMINTNFAGVFRMCQAYYKTHKHQGGVIVNISSILGLVGYSLSSVYCGTKGAVIQLTKALSAEWLSNGFRLNAICPGFINTEMTEMLKKKPELMKKFSENIPMKRIGDPEELVGAAIFLASNASSYMTGQIITIDGGATSIIK